MDLKHDFQVDREVEHSNGIGRKHTREGYMVHY